MAKQTSEGTRQVSCACITVLCFAVNPDSKSPELTVLDMEQATTVVKYCTKLLACPNLSPDALHANLRLCLRLMRHPQLAAVFVQEGGPQALLSLTQKSAFRGFSSLAVLLFRSCLECGPMLDHAMEAVVRQVLNPADITKESRTTAASREVHYVMRKLGPAACRNPTLFKETACRVLRLSSALPKPESYATSLRAPLCNLKLASGLAKPEVVVLSSLQKGLINLLIDHLCAETVVEESTVGPPERGEGGGGMGDGKGEEETERRVRYGTVREMVSVSQMQRMRHGSYRRQVHGNVDLDDDVASVEMNVDTEPISEVVSRQTSSTTEHQTVLQRPPLEADKKPLLSKSAVLRLLAELVDSYPSCANLIVGSSRNVRVDSQPVKVHIYYNTVEPLNDGHIGMDHFVHYREVVLFQRKNVYRLVHPLYIGVLYPLSEVPLYYLCAPMYTIHACCYIYCLNFETPSKCKANNATNTQKVVIFGEK